MKGACVKETLHRYLFENYINRIQTLTLYITKSYIRIIYRNKNMKLNNTYTLEQLLDEDYTESMVSEWQHQDTVMKIKHKQNKELKKIFDKEVA